MEFIVQLFRALASRERIRIVRLLAVLREMNVSQIAAATELGLTLVSEHLKVLAAAGLVWRRRSGRVVGYRLAEHAANPVTTEVLRMVHEAFSPVVDEDPKNVARADQSDSATNSDAALFACFTAFTHPRRLQIVRHLTPRGVASLGELASVLSMSQRACLRHLAKLERRGFVDRNLDGRRTTYILREGNGIVQQAVSLAIREYLESERQ